MKYLRRPTSAAANNGMSTTITPPYSAASFEVNSEPDTGARPSVRLYVGPELSRCVHMPLNTQSRILHLSCCTVAEFFITCCGSVSMEVAPPKRTSNLKIGSLQSTVVFEWAYNGRCLLGE
jgi:hypothetical protein